MTNIKNNTIKGKCQCCNEKIYADQIFVEKDNLLYHYSCYNMMVKKMKEKGIIPFG